MHGLFGRKSGTKSGFKFSDAMTKAGITWDDSTIDKYIADPKGFIPQNRMAFAGVSKPDERAAIIAYLKQATK
jgi:cytochrome c